MATSVISTARQQRVGLLILWLCIHFARPDYEHNLFNTMAMFSFGFLTFDIYCDQFDKYFAGSAKMAAASGEEPALAIKPAEKAAADASIDFALYHQDELGTSANWVAVNAAILTLFSCVWMMLATSGLPYIFHKVLPGPEALGYKLHLQVRLRFRLGRPFSSIAVHGSRLKRLPFSPPLLARRASSSARSSGAPDTPPDARPSSPAPPLARRRTF